MNAKTFEDALRRHVKSKFKQPHLNSRELFQFVSNVSSSQKHDMWKAMGIIMNHDKQKIHDFFHNKWSLQFYDDFVPHKNELKDISQNIIEVHSLGMTTELTKQAVIDETIDTIAKMYPEKSFYNRRIRMFLDYSVTKALHDKLHVQKQPKRVTKKEQSEMWELAQLLQERFNFD
uniref:Uncharacterized protein n=1 Tax=Trepomonas sp. PC1 TaxID=1076344 RepID=A0A146KF45_9EUKA|eukprot:JAP95410.1 Hypothetical protein TPC1_11612 [Trepomonas sp. PC1]